MPSQPQPPSAPPASGEGGSALVMVIFIIVVLALLLAALAYINAQSNQNTAYQIASTRAYWAAQSGAEWEVYQVISNNGSCASQTNLSYANPPNAGLAGCTTTVSCSSSPSASVTSYRISSQGTCPAGNLGPANRPVSAVRSAVVGITTSSGNCVGQCTNQFYSCYQQCSGGFFCAIYCYSFVYIPCLKGCSSSSPTTSTTALSYWLESP